MLVLILEPSEIYHLCQKKILITPVIWQNRPTSLTKGAIVFPQSVDSLSFRKAVVSFKTWKEKTVMLVLSAVIKKL